MNTTSVHNPGLPGLPPHRRGRGCSFGFVLAIAATPLVSALLVLVVMLGASR